MRSLRHDSQELIDHEYMLDYHRSPEGLLHGSECDETKDSLRPGTFSGHSEDGNSILSGNHRS